MANKRNTYKGGPKARTMDTGLFNPDLEFFYINPNLIKAHSVSDKFLRAEYSRLRAIANKRISRMEGKPEAVGTLANLPDKFPTVRGMDRAEVVRNLIDVSRFVGSERGSLSGIHETNKKIQEGLAKKGIHVPKEQLANFGTFMNAMKKALGLKRGDYGSTQLANLWQELFDKGKISNAEFERKVKELMKDVEATEKLTPEEARKQRREVNRLLKESPVDTYFDELALDPRTIKAKEKRDTRPQENARKASRRAAVKRRKRRFEN